MEMSQNLIDKIKKDYPKGTDVKLLKMKGESSMNKGMEGKVVFVDDIGQIHVDWENGSGLALVPLVDKFIKI